MSRLAIYASAALTSASLVFASLVFASLVFASLVLASGIEPAASATEACGQRYKSCNGGCQDQPSRHAQASCGNLGRGASINETGR